LLRSSEGRRRGIPTQVAKTGVILDIDEGCAGLRD